jgi:cholesterol transport system auxiliary component
MKRNKDRLPNRRAALRLFVTLPAAVALAACESFLPGKGPPPRLYRLTPKSSFPTDLPTVGWQLVVEVPFAPAGLNTTRIGLMHSQTQLEYYARSTWTDRAPLMVQTLMVESFENSGRIVAVGRESIGLRSDFVLKTELREFQAEYFYGGTPQVRVRVTAKLVRMPERAIVASTEIDHRADASDDRMEDIIAAFDDALGKVLRKLVEWTLVSGQAAARRA